MSPSAWILLAVAACFAVVVWLTMGNPPPPPKPPEPGVRLAVAVEPIVAGQLVFEHQIADPVNVEIFVQAFADAEGWRGRPGPRGEQGIWQWTEATWQRYSRRPFLWAALRTPLALEEQRATARRQLASVLVQYRSEGKAPTVTEVALAIAAGYEGASRAEPDPSKVAHAQRVANLYWHEMETREGGR